MNADALFGGSAYLPSESLALHIRHYRWPYLLAVTDQQMAVFVGPEQAYQVLSVDLPFPFPASNSSSKSGHFRLTCRWKLGWLWTALVNISQRTVI